MYYQQIPFDVPENWAWCRFNCIAELISGRDLNPAEYSDHKIGIPYITGASNFENGKLIINRWTNHPKVVSKPNDILITCKGTVGEIYINDIGQLHIARQLMSIRPASLMDISFLKYFFEYNIGDIKNAANGLIPGISRNDITDILITIPPYVEQKRIVASIELYIDNINKITENLN